MLAIACLLCFNKTALLFEFGMGKSDNINLTSIDLMLPENLIKINANFIIAFWKRALPYI